jgi:prepilin-type N-terminal cleavage/methylation domain-containing protein
VHHHDRGVDGNGNVFVDLIGQCVKHDGARPLAAPRFFSPGKGRGWTLVELVVVLAIGAILMYFAVRAFQPKEAIALQQAERLRDDLRHIQMLAITWNQQLRITTAANSYSVSCVTASVNPPCNAAPVIDPGNGRPYLVNLEPGLTLAGPGFSLDLDTLGRPKNGAAFIAANATFTITGASVARTVTVTPLTGFATAQ